MSPRRPAGARLLRQLLGWTVAALALAFVGRRLAVDWEQWSAAGGRLAWQPLALHLLTMALSFALLVAAWQRLLALVGGPLGGAAAAASWFAGAVGRYVPGKVTAFLARVVACQRYGVDGRRAGTALLVEQALYVAIALAVVGATAGAGLLAGTGRGTAAAAAVLLALGLALLLHPAGLRWLSHLLQRLAGRPREEVVAWKLRQLAPAAALATAGWVLHGVAGYFLVRALAPVPPSALPGVALAFVAAWGAGFLAFVTPAGLGVREAALTVLLAPFLPRPLDALAAVLGRLSWVALELAGLAASILLAGRRTEPGAKPGAEPGAISGAGPDASPGPLPEGPA